MVGGLVRARAGAPRIASFSPQGKVVVAEINESLLFFSCQRPSTHYIKLQTKLRFWNVGHFFWECLCLIVNHKPTMMPCMSWSERCQVRAPVLCRHIVSIKLCVSDCHCHDVGRGHHGPPVHWEEIPHLQTWKWVLEREPVHNF